MRVQFSKGVWQFTNYNSCDPWGTDAATDEVYKNLAAGHVLWETPLMVWKEMKWCELALDWNWLKSMQSDDREYGQMC